jgi:DnaJ-class molecular chaperone
MNEREEIRRAASKEYDCFSAKAGIGSNMAKGVVACPVCGGLGFYDEAINDKVVFVTCEYCEGVGSFKESESE